MSAKKFKFVSPGVFLSEIDNSQLPKIPGGVGPVIIGRTRRGPALKPVKISSFQEFVQVFGDPLPGNESEDPWRAGSALIAPSYAPLAAQAYLKADIDSPVTVIRLLGVQGDDASDAGQAGWEANHAYGLFCFASASTINASLVGIVYATNANMEVGARGMSFGNNSKDLASRANNDGRQTKAVKISNHHFTISLSNDSGTTVLERKVSLRDGSNYIREELNTNPIMTNSRITDNTATGAPKKAMATDYWLGETFEQEYEKIVRENSGKDLYVFAMRLKDGMDDFKSANHQLGAARTGWVIPQYNGAQASYSPESMERLFRFISLQEGEEGMDLNVKIENIKITDPGEPSPFGRFDVVIEKKRAGRIFAVESYEDLNLNPNSDNYIARRIGDQFLEWSSTEKRNKIYGNYVNQSAFVRVQMGPQVEENGPTNQRSVPFGFLGPIAPKSVAHDALTNGTGSITTAGKWVTGSVSIDGGAHSLKGVTINWPSAPHVLTGSRSPDLDAKFIFGGTQYNMVVASHVTSSEKANFSSVNLGLKDYLRRYGTFGSLASEQTSGIASTHEHSYIFSFDEVIITGSTALSQDMSSFVPTILAFKSGSHRTGDQSAATRAFTACTASNGTQLSASALLQVVNSFSMPFAGGFDGVDVTEADPFNNAVLVDKTTRNSYAYASIDRAIDLIKDPEALEMNLAAMPGITNTSLTTKLVQTCEARADALAVIDLPDIYVPPTEKICSTFQDRVNNTTPAKSAKALKARQINSSYGASYYPWVKVRDTINSKDIWAPPSVVALGVMGYTEQKDEVWFAPAGFNRGGLNEGNAGLPVLQASEQLMSSQRDSLYDANINPIASFVSEGLVVFGQKTLQMTPSALDRINVRRLLIFVKKEISRIASGLLFDQNVPATWARFTGQVVPFLESVKTRLGLTDFKVVLDSSTTTPDLVDRNIMYAKIFLKPARAIEFIAVDFVITRSGASFDD